MTYALLIATFIGVICGMTLRTASAFKEVGSAWAFMALLALAFSIGRGTSSLISGEAAKRYGSKVTALGFFSLGTVGLGYAFGPPSLYPILRIFHGISSGITWPSMQALVMNMAPPDKRARVASIYFFIGSLGMSIAYLIGSAFSYSALYVAPFVLYSLGITMLKVSGKVGKVQKKVEKGIFSPPSSTLFLMSMTTGLLNVLVNTEVTIAFLYSMLGKLGAGLALSFASAVGTMISYFLGKEMLDLKQSPKAIVVPGAVSLGSSSLVLTGHPAVTVLGITMTQGSTMWWRSLLMAVARSGDVGRRVGLINMGRDIGGVVGSSLLGILGPSALPLPVLLGAGLTVLGIGIMERSGATKV
ncbi:hypothetical protein IPA_01385 [Ignicoccus pacificus DSM 13166]|uniref:Major facilitator superfamily (MFS) profile domain-containing protein n=1 Tax=Ignicoccus pacificus DSM 13166 TaxID=940294 RepID=A0A977KAI4_9CREN|nr:hypothetical protein IPA_01385 [Ignicoccus pacificus DSM 13166]